MPAYPNYYYSDNTSKGRSRLQEMEDNWTAHSVQNLSFQAQADMDVRFYTGDQQVYADVYGDNYNFRQNFIVNLIKRLVEMPVGHQLQHRRSITTVPMESSDQLTSDQLTKILMWNDRQATVPDIFSDAFKASNIGGLCWVNAYLDYTHDPVSGDIVADLSHYSEVIFDPFFTRIDMTDCDYWWKRSYISQQQAFALMPAYHEDIKKMRPSGVKSEMDGKFQFTPQSIFYNSTKLFTYDEYFYRAFREQKMITNETNGTSLEWYGTIESLRDYLQYLKVAYPNQEIRVKDNTIPTIGRAIVFNGILMDDEIRPYKLDMYPVVPVMAYYTPQSTSLYNKIQGIVRGARDPQFLFNKFLLSAMDSTDAQPHSGYIATQDSVVNPTSLHKTGAGQVIWRKKGTTPDDVQKIQPPPPADAQMQFVEALQKLMIDTTGANETNLGLSDDKVAGVLNMLNQQAGMVSLASLFENLDRAMKQFGKIRLQMIQQNFVPAKVKRIINEEPSQQFYDRAFAKYDIAIEDGYDTSTQRQLAFAQALKLKELLPNEIPAQYIISKSTLQDKNDLIRMMEQQAQQQQQIQQAQAQSAMEEQQATIQMAHAQANYQNAGAIERQSRIIENEALAKKNDEEALFKKAETLKKIEEMDIAQIERLISIANYIDQKTGVAATPPAAPAP